MTVEDLVEELVGEIYDETDPDLATVVREDDGTIVLPGRFPVHDLSDIGVELPDGDYATLAGLRASNYSATSPLAATTATTSGWDLEVRAIGGRNHHRNRPHADARPRACNRDDRPPRRRCSIGPGQEPEPGRLNPAAPRRGSRHVAGPADDISFERARISLAETNAVVVEPEKQTPMLAPDRSAAPDRFSAMYASALPVVYGFISLRVGGNRPLAEDLTAETFVAAVAEYRAGRPEVVTTSWLCTVAKRRLIDYWRRRTVASKKVIPLAGRGLVFETPETGEREAVIRSLAALTPEQRTAIVLQHIEGYSVAEISEIVGRSPKAVESLLSRARRNFRAAYSEVDHD